MILDLVPPTDPILHQPLEEFDPKSIDLEKVVAEMFATMYHYNGVGLSANQVGLPYRMFVMGTPEIEMVFINPKIRATAGELVYAEEGCLTHPGLFINIKRPEEIRLLSTNMHFDTEAQTYKGMTARIIQHEMDHLDGIDYQRRANRIHLERARNQFKRKQRQRA